MLSSKALRVSYISSAQQDQLILMTFCYFSAPFVNPRTATARKRREVNSTSSSTKEVTPEMLTMYRAIEVFLPKDSETSPMGWLSKFSIIPFFFYCLMFFFFALAIINGKTDMVSRMLLPATNCLSPSTFYGVILGLGIVLLIIIAIVAVYVQRQIKRNRSVK